MSDTQPDVLVVGGGVIGCFAANCFIAGGNGMIGIATAPATGRLVAELVTGDQPHLDPSLYRPERCGRRGVAAA